MKTRDSAKEGRTSKSNGIKWKQMECHGDYAPEAHIILGHPHLMSSDAPCHWSQEELGQCLKAPGSRSAAASRSIAAGQCVQKLPRSADQRSFRTGWVQWVTCPATSRTRNSGREGWARKPSCFCSTPMIWTSQHNDNERWKKRPHLAPLEGVNNPGLGPYFAVMLNDWWKLSKEGNWSSRWSETPQK